jgi:hypothetical protein
MPTAFLEIIEKENGEVVLQKQDEEGAPLVTINFSAEARHILEEHHLDVARVMMSAGLQAVSQLQETLQQAKSSEEQVPEGETLH